MNGKRAAIRLAGPMAALQRLYFNKHAAVVVQVLFHSLELHILHQAAIQVLHAYAIVAAGYLLRVGRHDALRLCSGRRSMARFIFKR